MTTKSEKVLESFLTLNNLPWQKIPEVHKRASYRPDYLVQAGDFELIFEVKQLEGSFREVPGIHVRSAIQRSRKQIQYGIDQGVPSVLLIYNMIDPVFQLAGTEPLDFETAMYGEKTIEIWRVDGNTQKTSQLFNGGDDSLQENKNTSFSALGRLDDNLGKLRVTLFENVFAKVKVPFDQLPPCFAVKRVKISREPLSFT